MTWKRIGKMVVAVAIAAAFFLGTFAPPALAWSFWDLFKGIGNPKPELEAKPFTLQLLHASDYEAGLDALKDAPRLSAVLNALKKDYPNTIFLSSGDNYIPSPFLFASGDESMNDTPVGKAGIGRANIEIHNQLGIQASTFGNHDFDLGTKEVQDMIEPSGEYRGALFPYLSSNLDFSTDPNLASQVTADGQEASTLPAGRLAGSAVITVNGEKNWYCRGDNPHSSSNRQV